MSTESDLKAEKGRQEAESLARVLSQSAQACLRLHGVGGRQLFIKVSERRKVITVGDKLIACHLQEFAACFTDLPQHYTVALYNLYQQVGTRSDT